MMNDDGHKSNDPATDHMQAKNTKSKDLTPTTLLESNCQHARARDTMFGRLAQLPTGKRIVKNFLSLTVANMIGHLIGFVTIGYLAR
ncbi:MAG: hypothetical protein GX425_11950 [Peptococcaceae bacterium]|nr:hypothetical protein [Peptococcaceae bacterium]